MSISSGPADAGADMAAYCESVRTPYDAAEARRLGLGRSAYEYRRVSEERLLAIEYGGNPPPWARQTEAAKIRASDRNAAYWAKHRDALNERRRKAHAAKRAVDGKQADRKAPASNVSPAPCEGPKSTVNGDFPGANTVAE